MAERITSSDKEGIIECSDLGSLLEFHEEATLGILEHLPRAKTPEDGAIRTIAISTWLRNQGHSGATIVHGFDEDGEALGEEYAPLLAVELVSETHEARLRGTIQRLECITALSQPEMLDKAGMWMPTNTQDPTLVDDMCSAFGKRIFWWHREIWRAALAWHKSGRTHLMATLSIQGPRGEHQEIECMREVISFGSGAAEAKLLDWGQYLSKCLEGTEMARGALRSSLAGVQYGVASEARIARLAALDLDEKTSRVDSRPGRAARL